MRHYLAAERLLLIGHLDHVHIALKPEVCACHRKRRAPLTRSGLGGHAAQTLLLRVVRLRDRGIELVRTGGVVSLEFVVYLCRSSERLFKAVRTDERRRTVHLIEREYFLGNIDVRRCVVKLLLCKLAAEYRGKLIDRDRLHRCGIEKRRGLVLHIRTDIVPFLRKLILGEIGLVRNFVVFHLVFPFLFSGTGKQKIPRPCNSAGTGENSCGATLLDACASALRILHMPVFVNGGLLRLAYLFCSPSKAHSNPSAIPRRTKPRLSVMTERALLTLSHRFHRNYTTLRTLCQ